MKNKVQIKQSQQIEHKLSPYLVQQLKLTSLSQSEMEKYLYEVVDDNPYLQFNPQRHRRPFLQKLDLEYQDELGIGNSFIESSFMENIKEEVLFMGFNTQQKWIADTILSSVLPNGMLSISLDSMANYLKVSKEELKEVFNKIQKLAPIIELSENPVKSTIERIFAGEEQIIVLEYWDLLLKIQKSNITLEADKYQKSIKEIKSKLTTKYYSYKNIKILLEKMDNLLQELLMIQGLFESSQQNTATILKPDCVIQKTIEDKLTVYMGSEFLLELSAVDIELLDKKNKDQYKQAQIIFDTYQKRERLLEMLIDILVRVQQSYFFIGQLRPLTQKEVAQELKVEPSTISRLVNQKYFAYQDKILPLKTLFSKGLKQKDGNPISPIFIQEQIKDILTITRDYKISDEKLRELLAYRDISIARRTINKYRKQIKL